MAEALLHTLNGLTFGLLLFVVASGLTVIFGLMGVINLSHGALYLLGAYLGYLLVDRTGEFALALVVAPIAVGALGWVLDRGFRSRLYGAELPQVLLTIGIALIIGDAILAATGGAAQTIAPPEFLSGSVSLPGDVHFPRYRLAVGVFGIVVAVALVVLWTRTRLGAILRAGVDDAPTLEALGVNVGRVFTWTFVGGAALAAVAGVVGAPLLGVYPGMDFDILLYSIIVVVIGGLGSMRGALGGALVVGLADSFGKAYVPELSYFAIFGPAVLVLALRPEGLFATR